MNVEGGSVSAGVASAIGISAPSIEVGFVNEGPVASSFLENTMPLTLNS